MEEENEMEVFGISVGIIGVGIGISLIPMGYFNKNVMQILAGILGVIGGACAGAGAGSSSDYPNGSPDYVAFGTFLTVVAVIAAIKFFSQAVKEKKVRKEAEIKEAEEKKERESLQHEYEGFLDKNPRVKRLKETANTYLNNFELNVVRGSNVYFEPFAPTYTRGLIKGSLADNISTLSNAVKDADYAAKRKAYEEGMASNAKYMAKARTEARHYCQAEEKVIEALKSSAGGEKYIIIEDSVQKIKEFVKNH